MSRKQEVSKSSSVQSAVHRAQAARKGLAEWPSTVTRSDDANVQAEVDHQFAIVVAQRPADAWTPLDLNRAAQLARLMRLLDKDLSTLEQTGSVVSVDGKVKPSPMMHSVEKLAGLVQQHARSLGLTWQASDNRTASAHNAEFARTAGQTLINQQANGEAADVWKGLQ